MSLLPLGLAIFGVAVPPAVYAALVRWKFGMLAVSWYVPYEELEQALRGGSLREIYGAPIWSANMTSGLITANMYTLTLGEMLLSVLLGGLIGLNLAAAARLRRSCDVRTGQAMTVAATSGLASTLAASGTGILGCCGPALSGGMLALAGLSATTAQAVASVSPAIQLALVLLLGAGWLRLRGHRPERSSGRKIQSREVRPGFATDRAANLGVRVPGFQRPGRGCIRERGPEKVKR